MNKKMNEMRNIHGHEHSKPLLEVKDLTTTFHTKLMTVHAVNGISYKLNDGQTLGIVGESGCGKSVHALSIMRLLPAPSAQIDKGEVYFQGQDVLKIKEEEMQRIRGAQISMVFQDPMTSLNPVLSIGFQMAEMLRLHKGLSKKEARNRVVELLNMVGIPEPADRIDDYPHEFSGGMRQRVMIAQAISCNPKLLIADEPTTALDVTIQFQIINLVKQLRDEFGMAIIWITHDLGVIAELADFVNVMYAGRIIETGTVKQIFEKSQHPYTVGLLASLPIHNKLTENKLYSIPGEPPDLISTLNGCAFAPRCRYAVDQCREMEPTLLSIGDDHCVACWQKEKVAGNG